MITSIEKIINDSLVGKQMRIYKTTWEVGFTPKRKGWIVTTFEFLQPKDFISKKSFESKRIIDVKISDYTIKDVQIHCEYEYFCTEIRLDGFDNNHPHRKTDRDLLTVDGSPEFEIIDRESLLIDIIRGDEELGLYAV